MTIKQIKAKLNAYRRGRDAYAFGKPFDEKASDAYQQGWLDAEQNALQAELNAEFNWESPYRLEPV